MNTMKKYTSSTKEGETNHDHRTTTPMGRSHEKNTTEEEHL